MADCIFVLRESAGSLAAAAGPDGVQRLPCLWQLQCALLMCIEARIGLGGLPAEVQRFWIV